MSSLGWQEREPYAQWPMGGVCFSRAHPPWPLCFRSAGKAGWIAGTTFLILVVPLIIEMDREQQLVEFEGQQLGALTGKQ